MSCAAESDLHCRVGLGLKLRLDLWVGALQVDEPKLFMNSRDSSASLTSLIPSLSYELLMIGMRLSFIVQYHFLFLSFVDCTNLFLFLCVAISVRWTFANTALTGTPLAWREGYCRMLQTNAICSHLRPP